MLKRYIHLGTVLFLFATLFVSRNVFASHILAADLYYKWDSGNTYTITVILYGDCSPSSATGLATLPTASPQICIYRGSSYVTTIGLNIQPPSAGTDVTPVCTSEVGMTQCENMSSIIPGILKFVYTADYTLPAPAAPALWCFAYFGANGGGHNSARSGNITNLMNPGSTITTLYDTLDNSVYPNNSSTQFSVIPTPFFCLNSPDTYNPGCVNPTDSIQIDLVSALNSAGTSTTTGCGTGFPVMYTGTAWTPPLTPVSATTPLNVVAGSFSYNTTTGQLNFNPDALQRSTVVYNVREFRNGSYVGSCQREMNFLAQTCTASSATSGNGIDSVTNGTIVDSSRFSICNSAGPFSLFFDPTEPGTTNNIAVTASGLPTGSTLTIAGNGTPRPHVIFSWTSTGLAPGSYIFYLTYTDNNCPLSGTNTIAITVTITPSPTVTAGSPNICTDGSTFIAAVPGSGTWTLSNTAVATIIPHPPDSAIVSGVTAGTTLVAYSLVGCTTTSTITAVHILPVITGPSYVCARQSITMSDAVTGGSWTTTNSAVATADVHAGVIVGVSPGVSVISYTIGGSCITGTTITVRQSPDHGIITGDSSVCVGEKMILSDTVDGGAWSISNDSADISRDTVTGVFPGKDTIRYILTNAFCRDTATKPITIYAVPVAGQISGLPTLCAGLTTTLSDTAAGGVWSSMTTTTASITQTALVRGVSAGADSIKYTITNPGCSSVATYTISVYDMPVPGMIRGLSKVCAGAEFTLSDTTGGVWASSNTAIATIGSISGNVSALSTGTTMIHYIIGPNPGRCYGDTTFTLTVTPKNTLAIISTLSQITCNGAADGSITVAMSGGTIPLYFKYLWSDNDTMSLITGLKPGFDTLYVIEPLTMCQASDTFRITQPDSLLVTDTTTLDICKKGNGTVTLIVTGGTQPYTYLWSDNSTGSNLENLHAGTYAVNVTDHNGCAQMTTAQVTDNDCIIDVHDVITPNGDGVNDTWIIEGLDNYPSNTVQVFDKWGDMVYEQKNYYNNWSGRSMKGDLPDGTYYYVVKLNATNLLGKQNVWTGYLMIKR